MFLYSIYLLLKSYKINYKTYKSRQFSGEQNKIFKDKMSLYPEIIYYSPTDKRCLPILDLKPFRSCQRETFLRKRIPEYSCARKKTVDIPYKCLRYI